MASFKDQEGREWLVSLSGPSVLEIREACDPKFLHPEGGGAQGTFERLGADPVQVCPVLYLLCREQREERKVSERDFYLKVIGTGEAIQAASEALRKAILNFTQPADREVLELAAAQNEKIQQMARLKAKAAISDPALVDQAGAAMDNAIQQVMTRLNFVLPIAASAESPPTD